MMYAYIDGDDIGLKIENSFMNNDEDSLRTINNHVKKAVADICSKLRNEGHEIIFGGADGIICKKDHIRVKDLLYYVRGCSEEIKFSIGVGKNLRDSYLALRYAKSNGKNIAAIYENGFRLYK